MSSGILFRILTLMFCLVSTLWSKEYSIISPNKHNEVKITVKETIEFSVYNQENELLAPSTILLKLGTGELGKNSEILKTETSSVNNVIRPVIKEKKAEIIEKYNELKLIFKEDFILTFRAFDDGVAYRFETGFKDSIIINDEKLTLNFSPKDTIYFPEEESLFSHNERRYPRLQIGDIRPGKFCSLPVLIKTSEGVNVLITETALEDYAGLWLKVNKNHALTSLFAQYPKKVRQSGDRNVKVVETEDYIAKTTGTRTFPWRILAIGETDADLITNQLSYILAKPSKIEDTSWIRPGKVAWDWYNFNNIFGVDFEAGINTKTYKYFIDFASKYGIEYIILDEGWYELGDLMTQTPNMDVDEIIRYANESNVGVILWVVWKTLDDQLQPAFDKFEKWGVKGVKVDFMQRDDQWMVNYYEKIAREAAARKMLVDFHGSYKPAGLRRAYTNVITREGVRGLEWNKWSEFITPEHNLTLPFTRMVAGPMDYTPGAMVNAQKVNFVARHTRPMSMTTRCHQLAMYVVFESPLQMLADSPSQYLREPGCMEFLAKVPTVWDDTKVLHAKIGDYIALARKNNNAWYLGAMTDSLARDLVINFSFLDDKEYKIDIWQDGANAHRYASDFKQVSAQISSKDKMMIKLAPGGGWVARIYPQK